MADNILVKASNIKQNFKSGDETITILKKADFVIKNNTFNIIYGQSGSGKSTLLNILTGLQRPSKGTVEFEGENVYKLKPNDLAHFRANRIGIVYQQNFWVKSLNVIENISMPLYFLGYSRSMAAKKALATLETIGMQGYAEKHPVLLSGGEQQRIAVARALVNDPLFIIADEPTGSLDSAAGDMIMDLLHGAQTNYGRTIILVTHNMEYLPLADHLLHIQDGVVEEIPDSKIHAATDEMITNMRKRITRLGKLKQDNRSGK
jgi:putative ABC transport system ATP-binding protein